MRLVKVLALCALCVVLLCGRTAHAHTWVNDSTITLHDTLDFWMGQIGSQGTAHVDSLDDIWTDSTLRIGSLIGGSNSNPLIHDSSRIVVGLRRPDSLDPAVTTKIAGKQLDSAIMSVMHKATVNTPGYLKSWAAVDLDTNDFGMAIHPVHSYKERDTVYVNADGGTVNWGVKPSGADYTCVDETTPNDFTDYVYDFSLSTEYFNLSNPDTTIYQSFDSARVIVKGRVSGTGPSTFPIKLGLIADTGAGEFTLDTLVASAANTWYTEISRPFTNLRVAKLEALQIGFKTLSTIDAGDSAVVTWIALEIFYTHKPNNYDAYQPHTTWHYWYGTHRGLNYSDTTPWNGWGLTNSADVSATVDIDTATIASSAGTHRVNVTQWVESIINRNPSYTALNYNGMVMALPQAEAATGTLMDTAYVDADGTSAQWAASAGARFECVDETESESSAEYVSTTTVANRSQEFLVTPDTSQWEIIDSLRIILYATHTTTGTKSIQIWYNDNDGTDQILDTAVSGESGTYVKKTTRQFSMSKAQLPTMEIGFKNLAGATAGNTIRVDWIFVEIFGRRYDKYVTIGNVQPFAGYDSTWITCYYSQHGTIGSASVADTTLCPAGFNAKGTSSTNAINSTVCVKVQAATTGTLYSLKFWPDFGGSGTADKIMQLALYDSTRTTVIGSTDSTTWTGTTGSAVKDTFFTKTCNWGTPPTVTAGKTYWIAARFNNTSGSPSWTLVARVQASSGDSVYVKTSTGAGGAWTNMASGSSGLIDFKMSAVMYVVCPTSNNHRLLPSTGVGVKDQDELPLPIYAAKGYRWPTISQ